MSLDPTRDEMLTVLRDVMGPAFEDFDAEQAIYWFANDWHGGQSSNLYSALSMSQYQPGPSTNGPDEIGQFYYNVLSEQFGDTP